MNARRAGPAPRTSGPAPRTGGGAGTLAGAPGGGEGRRIGRRTLHATSGALAAGALAACGPRGEPVAGVVAFPERSLSYAPLLVAVKAGLYRAPPVRLALVQRASGPRVAAAVVDGAADAGAMTLPDLVAAVAAGAPLVAIGALTRRFAGQLVVAVDATMRDRTLAALLAGDWPGVRVGLQAGPEGTEQAMRFLLLASRDVAPRVSAAASDRLVRTSPPFSLSDVERGNACQDQLVSGGLACTKVLAGDPLHAEPRWIDYGTGEALVAALKDGRIAAFLGRSLAAAQATIAGGAEIVANFSRGEVAGNVTPALCHVLVVRRDRAEAIDRHTADLLHSLVQASARAAAVLAGPEGLDMVTRALPDRDPIQLGTALRLDHPTPAASAYALDSRLPPEAMPRLLALAALAGRPLALDARTLVSNRFVG